MRSIVATFAAALIVAGSATAQTAQDPSPRIRVTFGSGLQQSSAGEVFLLVSQRLIDNRFMWPTERLTVVTVPRQKRAAAEGFVERQTAASTEAFSLLNPEYVGLYTSLLVTRITPQFIEYYLASQPEGAVELLKTEARSTAAVRTVNRAEAATLTGSEEDMIRQLEEFRKNAAGFMRQAGATTRVTGGEASVGLAGPNEALMRFLLSLQSKRLLTAARATVAPTTAMLRWPAKPEDARTMPLMREICEEARRVTLRCVDWGYEVRSTM